MPQKLTRNRPTFARRFRPRLLFVAMVAAGQALYSLPSTAGPEGGTVTGGQGRIEQNGQVTTIEQLTDRLAIDWDSFDISADEIVNFLQPGNQSIALNRILGNNGSEILGQINANGQVVLVNPNGVVFGEGARVDVGGILASGLDIGVDDFMAGNLNFSALEGAEGRVVNRGIIQAATGGSIGLLGKQVENEGLISAHMGSVNLAAGREAVVTFDPEGLMGVRVTQAMVQEELGADAALSNSGTLEAQGGQILLTASTSQEIFSQAVNRGDLEQASSVVVHEDGSFTLGSGADVVNTGRLDVSSDAQSAGEIAVLGDNITHSGQAHASGIGQATSGQIELHALDTNLLIESATINANSEAGQGGAIKVLGHKVGLMGQSLLDASGASGGGDILLGGDYKGQNIDIRNAWRTYVGPEARLTANALEVGDGGRIIVWADDITRYYGNLEGKGKGVLGRGGFAEVSGKELLDFSGGANLSGPGGAGALLLDPRDISIVGDFSGSENQDDEIELSDPETTVAFDDFANEDVSFSSSKIEELLQGSDGSDSGTNVILEATRNIYVESSIEVGVANTNSLTLKAGDDIIQDGNANRISVGTGDLRLYAGVANCGNAACLSGGDNDLPGHNIVIEGFLDTAGEVVLRAADNVTISNSAGGNTAPSAVSIRAGNNITLEGDASITTAPGSSGNTITLIAGDNSLTDPTGSAENHIQLQESSTSGEALNVAGELNSGGGDISLAAGGALEVDSTLNTGGGAFSVLASGSFVNTGAIVTGTNGGAGDITINSAGNVTLGHLEVGTSDAEGWGGNVTATSGGDITLNEAFDFNNTGANDDGGNNSRALTLNAGNNLYIDARIYDSSGLVNGQSYFDTLDVTLNAGGNDGAIGDVIVNAPIYTAGGIFEATGGYFWAINDGVVNTNANNSSTPSSSSTGGHIVLTMTGEVSLDQLITKTGDGFGDLDITAARITGLEALVINGTAQFTATSDDSFMPAIDLRGANQLNGRVDITSAGETTLVNHRETALGGSSIGGDFNLTSRGDVQSDAAIEVAGNTTFTVSDGDDSHYAIDLDHNDNHFEGRVDIGRASHVNLRSQGSLSVGDIDTSGENNAAAGNITLTAAQDLTVGQLTANAGNRTAGNDGKNGGLITLESGNDETISLTADLSARGHSGEHNIRDDGSDGNITLNGDVLLNAESDAAITIDTTLQGSDADSAGTIIFSGTVDDAAGDPEAPQSLTLNGGDIELLGAIGASNSLDTLEINTRGDVSFGAAIFPNANEMEVNGLAGANNTLNSPNVAGDWQIEEAGSGTLSALANSDQSLSFTNMNTLVGSSYDDVFTVATIDAVTLSLVGNPEGNGVPDNAQTGNTLQGAGRDNEWGFDPNDGHSLNTGLSFSGFTRYLGGSGEDTFTVRGTSPLEGEIDGGAGQSNELDLSEFSASTTVSLGDDSSDWNISNIQSLVGGSEGDVSLRVASGTNTWTLTGADVGNVVTQATDGDDPLFEGVFAFQGVSALTGGAGEDTFIANEGASFIGLIDGGNAEGNTLDLSDLSGSLTLEVGSGSSDWNVVNIQTLQGDTDEHFTLLMPEGGNTWTIDGENSGSVGATGEEPDLEFIGFANLTGGTQGDVFAMVGGGSVTGQIDGGDGYDVNLLDYSGSTGTVDVTLGEALGEGGVSIVNIDGVVGQSDGLSGSSNNSTLSIASGNSDDTTWTIGPQSDVPESDGVNDGYVTNGDTSLYFINFNVLNGGSGDDEFVFVDGGRFVGSFDGGDGANSVMAGSSTRDLSFSLKETPLADTHLKNVGEVVANASQVNTLVGADLPNEWSITGAEGGGTLNEHFTFAGFSELVGGTVADEFVLSGEGRVDYIDGGGSQADKSDSVELIEVADSMTVALDLEAEADLTLSGIDSVSAEGDSNHELLGDNRDNTWVLATENSGTLNGEIEFSSFYFLQGNAQDDTFVITGEDAFAGRFSGGEGDNTLDLTELSEDTALTLALTAREEKADLLFSDIDSIIAHSGAGHTLMGAHQPNDWQIESDDSGSLNQMGFSGVANLVGGNDDDRFEYQSGGSLSGQIDGGGYSEGNTLDGSALDRLNIILGADGNVTGVQAIVGNNRDSRLQGNHSSNIWDLNRGENAGTLNSNGNGSIEFEGVTDLVAGSGGDTFNLSGGYVTGRTEGGAGNDRFNLTLTDGYQGSLDLRGGSGNNELLVVGDGGGYEAEYSVSGRDDQALTYIGGANDSVLEVTFRGMSRVQDDTTVERLTLSSTVNDDQLTLGDNSYQVNDFGKLFYRDKTHLNIAASSGDQLDITGSPRVLGTLTIRNALVSQSEADASISARALRLIGVDSFGTRAQPVHTSINTLSADMGHGGLYLYDDGALELTAFSSLGDSSLRASGELSAEAGLSSTGALDLHSELGGIRLLGDNQFAGRLNLQARGDVAINNRRQTQLGDVDARSLALNVTGALLGENRLVLEELRLDVDGNVALTHSDNAVDQLRVTRSDELTYINGQALRISELTSRQAASVQANGLTLNGSFSAASAQLDSGSDALRLNARIDAGTQGTVSLRGERLEAGSGQVLVDAQRLELVTRSGVGVDERLNIDVDELVSTNENGIVRLRNRGELRVERLANNGSIDLINMDGDVVLDGRGQGVFDRESDDARTAGGTANSNYEIGGVVINIDNGSLLALGSLHAQRPDLVGRDGTILVDGNIGSASRPLVMYFKNSLFMEGIRSWPPVWSFGQRPASVEDSSTIQVSLQDLLQAGSEQLVEVESLEEIDPAIFTEVRNYAYDDISVLLPTDQRYDDDGGYSQDAMP